MNRQSFIDKRRNKKLQKGYDEIAKTFYHDDLHLSNDDFLQQLFPEVFRTGRIHDITLPITPTEKAQNSKV